MKSVRFCSVRAVLACAVLALLFPFVSCSSDDEEPEVHYDVYPVELSADDPVSGVYSTTAYSSWGAETAYIFRPSIAYATACSCAKMDAPAGTENTDYLKISAYGADTYFNLKDANKVYVVYNLFSDADKEDGISPDELDKHSGVIIFQAKHSPYGTPQEGCFYGVKFQFLTKDGQLPASANKDSAFSEKKVYIEGAAGGDAYKNINSLDDAVEKFGFKNSECFSASSWTSSASGADKTRRAAVRSGGMAGAVFTKIE